MEEFQITDEEALAVVVSAYRSLVMNQVSRQPQDTSRPSIVDWRFSGRWWSAPVVARRARPW
ncbi:MAG: hypothetical protein M0019_06625 [Actinomycetota bacterium]|nr:hypothetical protein [Actinomycetota bacterium]